MARHLWRHRLFGTLDARIIALNAKTGDVVWNKKIAERWPAASGAPKAASAAQRPDDTPRDFVGQTLDEIVARGWTELALCADFAPCSWDDGGTPRGFDVEIGRILAEALGVGQRFRFVQTGETLEADLLNRSGRAPWWAGMCRTSSRADLDLRYDGQGHALQDHAGPTAIRAMPVTTPGPPPLPPDRLPRSMPHTGWTSPGLIVEHYDLGTLAAGRCAL